MTYNKNPIIKMEGYQSFRGYEKILQQLKKDIQQEDFVMVVDTYPGVRDEEVIEQLLTLCPSQFINMKDIFKDEKTILEQTKYHITEDRVFGKLYFGEVLDFIDIDKLNECKDRIKEHKGWTILYGFGASLVTKGNMLVYLDMARWEIQLRYRNGMGNYNLTNYDEDILRKYKRAFFMEWRIADKHKSTLFNDITYFIDSNIENDPKMIRGETLLALLDQTTKQPFRTVPYFDPGVWGGQWMKDICNLDKSKKNFAWAFDGVPEENSLLYEVGNHVIEIPAMNLILYKPQELLGQAVYARFGAEFPIRFDFLDTIGGQNLSLQVHPVTEYIKKQFGMSYTQDESYYILDAKPGAVVYLGTKESINKEEMIQDLKSANNGEMDFDTVKYINEFPAKKHDHFLIPAGTIHCSGKDAMVLEISATPYIFTFKLWDWGRLGLDGKPRPVHIEHGEKVIQWDRTTKWVEENLVNDIYEITKNENYVEEHTGLHALEFIETRRYWIEKEVVIETKGTVNMLNLIEGEEAIVESTTNAFAPYIIHYAETFIVPANVKEYRIKAHGKSLGKTIGVIKAYVRN